MWLAIWIGIMLITPFALLKAYELYKVKKNKKWSDEPIEHIDLDLWDYPSNFYKRR